MKKITSRIIKLLKSPRKMELLRGFSYNVLRGGIKGARKFIHELETQKKEIPAINNQKPINMKDMFVDKRITFKLSSTIDIVIPIYNGFNYLELLFTSLYKNTTSAHRIIILNDASPDAQVAEFLSGITKYQNQYCQEFILQTNDVNLGFVQTVNSARNFIQNNFVILNTDVEVPDGWLERLMYPFEQLDNIASTTPFTNSGTICSFPRWLEDNQLPFGLNVNEVDSVFKSVNLMKTYAKIPTGVGFCMGINKSLVDKIGLFDADVFGKGYCEENDWCQRAIHAGYKNIHVTNLFVYHKHGGSFGELKQNLIKNNHAKLLDRHPHYDRAIGSYIAKNPLKNLRKAVLLKLFVEFSYTQLVVDHGLGGGATKYLNENILNNSLTTLVISGFFESEKILIQIFEKKMLIDRVVLPNLQYFIDNFLAGKVFLQVHLNHVLTISNLDVLKLILDKHSLSTNYYVHDFIAICPSYTLLNNEGSYCGTELDIHKCENCQINNKYQRRNNLQFTNMLQWRNQYSDILSLSHNIFCFSGDSSNHLIKVYPHVEKNVIIKPHKLEINLAKLKTKIDFNENEIIRVGVTGAVNYQKGRSILQELAKLPNFKHKLFELILIGFSDVITIRNCKITGKYNTQQLPELIIKNHIDLFIIPSIWPETFCYTAEEIMAMGFPLICFNIGAPAERVKNYEYGFICKEISAISMYHKIVEVAKIYGFKF